MKVLHPLRRYRVALALLLVVLLLALLLHNLVQSFLAAPAAHALWWLRLQYLRIPQSAIWLLLMFLAYLLFHASLLKPVKNQPWQWEQAALSQEQHLKKLTELIEHGGSPNGHRRLAQTISALAVTALSQRTGRSPHQVKADILQHRLDLPEDIASYLSEGLQTGDHSLFDDLDVLPDSQLDPRFMRTLEFLENEEWMEKIDGS